MRLGFAETTLTESSERLCRRLSGFRGPLAGMRLWRQLCCRNFFVASRRPGTLRWTIRHVHFPL
jgi:hypothetical protein